MVIPAPPRMIKLVLAWVLGGLGSVTNAQLVDHLEKLIFEDSLAAPKYDSTYVMRFRNSLVLSGVVANQGFSVDIEDKQGNSLSYATNTAVQYGLSVALNWFSVEATFSIPSLSPTDPAKGTSDTRTFGLAVTTRHLWIRSIWNTSKGFYAQDPLKVDSTWVPGDDYPTRSDLESLTYMASANYGFNKRHRFSQTAALSQMEQQRKSAGTGVIGGSFWYSRITSDGSLVPAFETATYDSLSQFDRLRRYILAVKGGYTHTFTFWGRGYVNLLVLPGIGVQQLAIRPIGSEELSTSWDAIGVNEFRFGMGYNGPKWYSGFTVSTFVNSGEVSDAITLGTTYTSFRFAAGIRLRPPNSGFMRRIGL